MVTAQRNQPTIKPSLTPTTQSCYRGAFEKRIQLPATSFFNGIQSTLTPENILIITVPKVLIPKHLAVTIEQ